MTTLLLLICTFRLFKKIFSFCKLIFENIMQKISLIIHHIHFIIALLLKFQMLNYLLKFPSFH